VKKIRDPDPTRAGVGLWAVGILTSHPWSQEIPRIGSGCHVDLALCAFYFFFFFLLLILPGVGHVFLFCPLPLSWFSRGCGFSHSVPSMSRTRMDKPDRIGLPGAKFIEL
jgi:hypothetical protein